MNRRLGLCVLFLFTLPLFASPTVESEVKARGEEFAAAWNHHDPKAMAGIFAPDGDLANPIGKWAKGQAEIEKLFAEEQSGMMKKSTYKNTSASVRTLSSDTAVADWDIEITNEIGPDGKTMPVDKAHVTCVMKKASGKWWVVSGRAFEFAKMPMAPMGKK